MIKNNQFHIIKAFLLFLLLSASCKKEPERWEKKYIIYKDSLYKTPLDTILVFEKDSSFVKRDGYYNIYSSHSTDDYSTGKIKNHKKVGLWKSYFNNALQEEENYNDKGELDGFQIVYDQFTGKFISVYHFVNGEQEGIQKEYHTENNKLARVYTLYQSSYYRGEYICYNLNGKIIYQENFGKDGTGYYKEFDNEIVVREGKIIKDKSVGIHIYTDYFGGDNPLIENTFNDEKGRVYKVSLYGNLKALYKTDGDSMIYDYDKNITKRTTFLKGKLIKREQFNDTTLAL